MWFNLLIPEAFSIAIDFFIQHSQTADEEDYEDLNGVPPPMGKTFCSEF